MFNNINIKTRFTTTKFNDCEGQRSSATAPGCANCYTLRKSGWQYVSFFIVGARLVRR